MESGAGVERIGAHAKAAAESDRGLDRLVRRNCDHSVLKLVELLPAVEKLLEGGVAGALERPADACSDLGRSEAQLLQLGRCDLIADVERLGDEGGLRHLRLLDASERPLVGDT